MSDIGLIFSAWDLLLFGLIAALPATTILLAVAAVGRLRMGRAPRRRRLARALNAAIAILAPLWAGGAGLLSWLEVNDLIEHARAADRHFTLAAERVVDGIVLPAGAEVALNGYDRLDWVLPPAGATVAVDGVAWAGRIGFVAAYGEGEGVRARVRTGTPAADATLDGVPCRAGREARFWDDGGLWSCTLAAEVAVQTGLAADGPESLVCAADRRLELQPAARRQVARCTLARRIEALGIPCAAGAEIELYDARLIGCALAAMRRLDGAALPPGAIVRLTDAPRRLEQFTLPAAQSPLRAFGMDLPPYAKVVLCRDRPAVDQVVAPDGAFVEIAGVKLTGVVNFDCGRFAYGDLFEDTRIGGEAWAAGRTVFRKDIEPAPSDPP